MLLVCLNVCRPRRLRHLRRLAETPVTATRLPGRPLPAPLAAAVPQRLPDGFRPATSPTPAPTGPAVADADELAVRAWLHHDQHGHTNTDISTDAEARR
ncbi:hypothetical protein ACWCXX_35840 [Streptomyces sp. NPDC001732]